MDITVIVMLVIGALLAVAGFILPEKKEKRADTKKEEEKIRAYTELLMAESKNQVEDAAEESVQNAVGKTERALERLTNEKMLAVNEYSDTVLKEINRSHEEVMFLYDMLNDKQKQINKTVADVSKTVKKAQEDAADAQLAAAQVMENMQDVTAKTDSLLEAVAVAAEKEIQEAKSMPAKAEETVEAAAAPSKPAVKAQKAPAGKTEKAAKAVKSISEEPVKKQTAAGKARTVKTKEAPDRGSQPDDIRIQFAMGDEQAQNNNTRILELHKTGKSNMAIARELGLGIGEVKLVIDLFEGM